MDKQFSLEQARLMEQSRSESDAQLVEKGAFYVDRGLETPPQLVVTEEQIENAKSEMAREISRTSFGTINELGAYTDVPYAQELASGLGLKKEEYIKSGMPFWVELRYKCSDRILVDLIDQQGIKQIVELASGFTPHAINLVDKYPDIKYVEVDYGAELKQKIVESVRPDINRVEYVAGNFLNDDTQNKIESSLEPGPVALFSEGLMMYLDEEARAKLGGFIKRILAKHGGAFFFEDNTTFNPEFRQRIGPIISQLHKNLASAGKTSVHQKSWSQEVITKEFSEMGFDVVRIPEQGVSLSFDSYPYRDVTKDIATQQTEAETEGKKLTREEVESIAEDAQQTFNMWVLKLKDQNGQ